jgi:hypothetical protein
MTDKQTAISLSVSQTFVLLMPSELTRVCVYRGFIYGCRFSVAAPYQGKSKIAAPAAFHGLIEGERCRISVTSANSNSAFCGSCVMASRCASIM